MVVSEIAKANDEKFKKMKDIYGKLREEHVQLLRTVRICSSYPCQNDNISEMILYL